MAIIIIHCIFPIKIELIQLIFQFFVLQTLIVASAKVEPSKGSEFCRASTMCHLHLTVERVSESLRSSLMYEVLVDQTMWAVCGRTTGVVSFALIMYF